MDSGDNYMKSEDVVIRVLEPCDLLSKKMLLETIRSVEGVTDSRTVKDRIDWLIANNVIKHEDWAEGHGNEVFIIIYAAPPPPAAAPTLTPPHTLLSKHESEFDDMMKGYT
jgi:hypothetical protein